MDFNESVKWLEIAISETFKKVLTNRKNKAYNNINTIIYTRDKLKKGGVLMYGDWMEEMPIVMSDDNNNKRKNES